MFNSSPLRTRSSRRSTRSLPRTRNNSTALPSRRPGIRGPSSVVLAAWEEVLAGIPFVVEEGSTGPEEVRTGLGEVRIDPEEDRSRPAGAAGDSSWTFWLQFA